LWYFFNQAYNTHKTPEKKKQYFLNINQNNNDDDKQDSKHLNN